MLSIRKRGRRGYVGVGKVLQSAVIAKDFTVDGKGLDQLELACPAILDRSDDPEKAEYPVRVEWKVAVGTQEAKWKRNAGLFSYRKAVASLDNQRKTLEFVAKEFGIKLDDLLS